MGRKGGTQGKIDCNAVMSEVMQSLGPAIQESGAVVTYDSLPEIWGDRSLVSQLLQNLIGNAIKFRGENPPAITVKVEPYGPHWLFSVSDNGIGIASEYVENIFVIFQRLHTRAE